MCEFISCTQTTTKTPYETWTVKQGSIRVVYWGMFFCAGKHCNIITATLSDYFENVVSDPMVWITSQYSVDLKMKCNCPHPIISAQCFRTVYLDNSLTITQHGVLSTSYNQLHICRCLGDIRGQIILTQIAKILGPTWGPPGADRTQVGPSGPHVGPMNLAIRVAVLLA